KTVILHDPSQPVYLEGYHKGAETDPDQPVFDAIDDILSRGRTSRLYRDLVRDKKLAVAVQSFSSFPGEEYPNLWGVFAVPAKGVTNQQIADEIHKQLERLKSEPVSAEELAKFKTRAKADLVRSLDSNSGLANELASYQTIFGDWRELFRYIDRLDKVSAADIQRVAKKTFVATNRTVGEIVTQSSADQGTASGTESGAAQ
ncbi:MAG TPA: insulinase family protein, partial [Thermoanaerobaculia bacterium]|nr:insulinase family protein [Thermoanaerobaculia bacterium]